MTLSHPTRVLGLILRATLLAIIPCLPQAWNVGHAEEPQAAEPESPGKTCAELKAPAPAPQQPIAVKQSVVVILDCSYSMAAIYPEPGGNVTTRMESAKSALQAFVARVRPGNDLGVYFFGHRAGWQADPNKPREVLLQKKYITPPPNDLQPYEDVEQVLKLGRYGQQQHQKVKAALDTVRPWGETPLYLSIREATFAFNAQARPENACIVVLTDGMNNVLQPTREKLVTKEILLAALKTRPIPVHIVGIDFTQPIRAAASQDFIEIADNTEGSYYETTGPADLQRYLALLRLGKHPRPKR